MSNSKIYLISLLTLLVFSGQSQAALQAVSPQNGMISQSETKPEAETSAPEGGEKPNKEGEGEGEEEPDC